MSISPSLSISAASTERMSLTRPISTVAAKLNMPTPLFIRMYALPVPPSDAIISMSPSLSISAEVISSGTLPAAYLTFELKVPSPPFINRMIESTPEITSAISR